MEHVQFGKQIDKFLVMPTLFVFIGLKLIKMRIDTFLLDFLYSRPKKCVFGPGDVLACPIIYRFVYQSANVPPTLFDP